MMHQVQPWHENIAKRQIKAPKLKFDSKRYGIEIKFSETRKITKSMHIAIQDLDLEHLWIAYSVHHIVPLETKITLVPLNKIERINALISDIRKNLEKITAEDPAQTRQDVTQQLSMVSPELHTELHVLHSISPGMDPLVP